MHVLIINGSPRTSIYSNTDRIIDAFADGLTKKDVSYERYIISDRNSWNDIRNAYVRNNEILIALPLYVECVPGLLLEFLETLPRKDEGTRLSFILQSGFAEGCQLRCGEEFLKNLPKYLGVQYGGTLVKGDNFGIRIVDKQQRKMITNPYREMGERFAEGYGFDFPEAARFTGPEHFSWSKRFLLQLVFKTVAMKIYNNAAKSWGCTESLAARPYR